MSRENDVNNVAASLNNYGVLECSRDYNLWSPLSSSKNAIVDKHVFTDVAVVFPKLSIYSCLTETLLIGYEQFRSPCFQSVYMCVYAFNVRAFFTILTLVYIFCQERRPPELQLSAKHARRSRTSTKERKEKEEI